MFMIPTRPIPSAGPATHEAVAHMAQMLLANLTAHFAGKPLISPVRG